MQPTPLILASASPRRTELLHQIGIAHCVMPAEIDETVHAQESIADGVVRLAQEKAYAISHQFPHSVVLAADTIVVLDGEILSKPKNIQDAERMLQILAGKWHQVTTAFAIQSADRCYSQIVSTRVKMGIISIELIQQYIASGEPFDKAGSYGIQSAGAMFIEKIEGDFYTVVGLPLFAVCHALRLFGISPCLSQNS